ncbi:MAG: hypothetical protein K0Q59_4010 [Paenibacillus sp.]|jgi:uncharacterized protein YpmB|nr:hypothetical protein [Paenibacillus sp.]
MAKKITYGAVLVVVIAIVTLVFFYRSIHGEQWAIRDAAIQTVTSQTYMATVDRVEPFIGEKPYMIVFGKDPDGQKAIAWVDGSNARMKYESSGVSEDDVRQTVMALNPDNDIKRVLPGILNDTYVWEVLYNREEQDGSTRYYYGYYRFDNGAEIDTWKLSKRK